jgi:hypothetical protein
MTVTHQLHTNGRCACENCGTATFTMTTRAAGRTPMRGLARPSAEVVEACVALRVWVWGAWFGFALQCVALLCGVFVRLHLALFPASMARLYPCGGATCAPMTMESI